MKPEDVFKALDHFCDLLEKADAKTFSQVHISDLYIYVDRYIIPELERLEAEHEDDGSVGWSADMLTPKY